MTKNSTPCNNAEVKKQEEFMHHSWKKTTEHWYVPWTQHFKKLEEKCFCHGASIKATHALESAVSVSDDKTDLTIEDLLNLGWKKLIILYSIIKGLFL